MHPELQLILALILVERAAFALERNAHKPGVSLFLEVERLRSGALLSWPRAEMSKIDQHDRNRITEDGAEAVALAIVHRYRAWRIIRRLQRGEHADWLLEELREGVRQEVALEVSGVDMGGISARLSEKLAQVSRTVDVDQKWACVVGFEEPTATLQREGI